MKRDWDTVRALLLAVEALGDTNSQLDPASVPQVDAESFGYHVALLVDADLVRGRCLPTLAGPVGCIVTGLTWEGHELLDKVRSVSVWNKVKATARERGLSLTIDLIRVAAGEIIKSLMVAK